MMISVVLNVLNEKRHMRDLLDSLVIQEKPWEIVVVDAGSNDGTVEIVQNYMKKHPDIKFFHCPGTRGESTNFGIQQAKGGAVATTGGDCIANPFWLKELRRSLLQYDIVAGRTINIGFHAWEDLERVELHHKGFDISFPSASMAWRKEVLDDVGGFDPWFVTAEDIDINLRAVDRGYTMTYNPDAIVYHRTKGSYKGFFKQAFWNGWGRKQLTVKHGKLWSSYKPQRLVETSRSMWAMARLAVALTGYVSCKLFEKVPEELMGDRSAPGKRKRKPFKFVYPGR